MTPSRPEPARGGVSPAVQDRLTEAASRCRAAGETWTAPRDRVYRLLLEAEVPLGAYDLIDHLSRPGQPVGPPTVYRALEFLLRLGLVHRIESRNAFVACAHPGAPHQAQFAICERCGRAEELTLDTPEVARASALLGFEVRSALLEVSGLCPACQRQGGTRAPVKQSRRVQQRGGRPVRWI